MSDSKELVERLRYHITPAIADQAADALEALEAENARLREALRNIELDCDAEYPPSHGAIKYAARAAIREASR